MSDYHAWPVWGADGGIDPELSTELAADLRAWDELFQEHFHYESGWRSPRVEAEYARAAPDLRGRLEWELGVPVTLDLWPVTDPELLAWVQARTSEPPVW